MKIHIDLLRYWFMFILKGLIFIETEVKTKPKIHKINFIKILVIVILPMQAILMAIFFVSFIQNITS